MKRPPVPARPLLRTLAAVAAVATSPARAPAEGGAGFDLDPFWMTGAVAAGDVDGDGRADLVVAQSLIRSGVHSGRIVVLLRDASRAATFRRDREVVVGNSPAAVVLADLDGDGTLDVATADDGGATIVLLPRGAPRDRVHRVVPGVGWGVAAGDLDGDGRKDVVVATSRGTYALFQSASTAGDFDEPVRIGPAGGSAVVADFDGDGRGDVAVSDYGEARGRIVVIPSDAAVPRGFRAPVEIRPPGHPTALAAADFDGDGLDDLAFAADRAPRGYVSVCSATGDEAVLGPPRRAARPGERTWLVAADMDGDGVPDLVTGGQHDVTVSVQTASARGTFRRTARRAVGWWPLAGCVGDFDDDGMPDVIVPAARLVAFLQKPGRPGTLRARIPVRFLR